MGHGLTSLYHGYGSSHIIHVIAGGMLGTLGKGAGATGIRKAGTPGTGRDSWGPGDWWKMFSALFVEEDVPVLLDVLLCCFILFFFVGYSYQISLGHSDPT